MNWWKNSQSIGLRALVFRFSALLLVSLAQAQPSGVLAVAEWSNEPVADGIVLQRAAFEENLFGANQYLCVLEVAPGARFDIVPAAEGTLETTSALAARTDAVAAVNGSFFRMSAPYGSVNYLRVDSTEVSPNVMGGIRKNRRTLQQTGAIATFCGSLYMLKGDALGRWEQDIEAEDVVTTGPVLLAGGEPVPIAGDRFNTNRHPRTAAGRRADGTVVLVVADGRNKQAAGLTMAELQQVMTDLGCVDAINLDGGGSTAMVVGGTVVNHPSDNKQFDNAGERPVANAIVVTIPSNR